MYSPLAPVRERVANDQTTALTLPVAVMAGVAWNVKNGAPLGTSALPHLEFWRQLPDLVKVRVRDGVAGGRSCCQSG